MIFIIDNNFFKQFIDKAGVGFGLTDLDGNIIYLNKTLCQLVEIESIDLLIGQDVTKFNTTFGIESERKKIFEEIKKKGSWTGELPIKTISGKIIPTLQNLIILRDKNTSKALYFANTVTDISYIKALEGQLTAERSQLLSIFNGIREVIYVADPITYEILFVNYQLMNLYEKDPTGKKCYEEFQGLKEPCSFCTNKIILSQKYEPYRWEYYNNYIKRTYMITDRIIKWPDGRDVRFEIAIDITEQKRIETELNKERELLAVTLSGIDNGVITCDTIGKILLMNAAAQLITGFNANESIGKFIDKVIVLNEESTHQKMLKSIKDIVISVSSGNKSDLPRSAILVTKEGEEKIIESTISPLLSSTHEIIGTVFVFRDITQQRRLEMELFKKQKLESVGILAGGIAHDFNNLLTSILGNLSVLRMDLKPEPNSPINSILTETDETIHRARNLTKQLLTFSKGGAPVKNIEDIGSIIKDTTEFTLRGTLSQVEYNISKNLWLANVDKGQIGQVIQNLVLNASQAMNNKGIIKIYADNFIMPSDNVFSLKPGNYIRVVVEDNGVGIPEQNLNKIFDLYFTTKPSGAGFGLSICNSIITRHGGIITVDSKLNVGSKFTFFLPASPDAVRKTQEKNEKILLNGGRILVLEDEETVAHVLKSMLKRLNFEVEMTSDGVETIDVYKRYMQDNKPFDVVILDLTIQKGMDGAETIKKLLQIDPNVKYIISSGYASNEIMSNYEKYGFKECLEKPFTVTELANKLNKIMKK